LAGFFFISLLI